MRPWAKLPTWWYPPGCDVLTSLKGGAHAGDSQAALRVYMALAGHPKREALSYTLKASLSDLEKITQLSRSLVLRGIHRAQDAGLITYAPGSRAEASTFSLVNPNPGAGGWAKMPMQQVHTAIPTIPHRGATALAALKIYLVLLAARSNDNAVVALRHDTMREKTGCQPNQLRAALSLLAIHGLLHVIAPGDSNETSKYQVQKYHLLGRLEAPRQWGGGVVGMPTIPA